MNAPGLRDRLRCWFALSRRCRMEERIPLWRWMLRGLRERGVNVVEVGRLQVAGNAGVRQPAADCPAEVRLSRELDRHWNVAESGHERLEFGQAGRIEGHLQVGGSLA